MREPVTIRAAISTDVPALVRFQKEGWFHDYRGVIPDGYGEYAMQTYGTPEVLREQVGGENVYLVAEVDGAVVGCATAEVTGSDEAELWWIHTTRMHRGSGIGRMLVYQVRRLLDDRAQRLFVTTFAAYEPALAFYKRLGFVEQSRHVFEARGFRVPEVRLSTSIRS